MSKRIETVTHNMDETNVFTSRRIMLISTVHCIVASAMQFQFWQWFSSFLEYGEGLVWRKSKSNDDWNLTTCPLKFTASYNYVWQTSNIVTNNQRYFSTGTMALLSVFIVNHRILQIECCKDYPFEQSKFSMSLIVQAFFCFPDVLDTLSLEQQFFGFVDFTRHVCGASSIGVV